MLSNSFSLFFNKFKFTRNKDIKILVSNVIRKFLVFVNQDDSIDLQY